jgi:predicted RNA-binding Zn ribbon-like protein
MGVLPGDTDLALAFVNTCRRERWGRVDDLASLEGVRAWLTEFVEPCVSGASTGISALDGPPVLRMVAEEAHRLRDAARTLFRAQSARTQPARHAVFAVDRLLAAARLRTSLSVDSGDLRVTTHYEPVEALGLLAPVAHAVACVVESADPSRLRPCAAPGCPQWFLDTSKAGRRRWCSMARCGNRRKAARHRAKKTP